MSRWPSFAVVALATMALLAVTTSSRADDPPAGAPTAIGKPIDLENTTCPVKGIPVKPGITEVVNGTIVHFCCPMCAAKYQKDPSAYEAALRADPAVASKLDGQGIGNMAARMPASHTGKDTDLHDGMRRLWEDHVSWTRLFVVSRLADLPDLAATTKRLLKNQVDIGDAIKPYYGAEAGTKLTVLLNDHILTAADLVGALKSGDSEKATAAKTKWAANADDIAAFLSGANPSAWPLDDAKAMMREHLDLTATEVTARLKQDWDADIAAYGRIRDQALAMADMLSSGIQQQFPAKFR